MKDSEDDSPRPEDYGLTGEPLSPSPNTSEDESDEEARHNGSENYYRDAFGMSESAIEFLYRNDDMPYSVLLDWVVAGYDFKFFIDIGWNYTTVCSLLGSCDMERVKAEFYAHNLA